MSHQIRLSIWYPFSYADIQMYWNKLEKGSAHYSVFISDTEWLYSPKLGLSFNNHIRWSSALRSKWTYSFQGYMDGTGGAPVDYNDHDYLDSILPLDLSKELWERQLIGAREFDQYKVGVDWNRPFPELSVEELHNIIRENPFTFLVNESIWTYTISKLADSSFCAALFAD